MTFTLPNLTPPAVGTPLSQSYLYNQMYNPLGFLLNPPRYKGYCTSSTTVSTQTTLVMDTTIYDNYGGHSGASPTRYTVQVPGLYLLTANLGWGGNSATYRILDILVNGSFAPGGRVTAIGVSGITQAMNVSTLVQLNVGDYVEMAATSGTAVATTTNGTYGPYLTCTWVSNS